jgi:hypothetical protein
MAGMQKSKISAPEVESRWVFISTNKQIRLAAEAASYMAVMEGYVSFFEFPSLDYPYTGSADFGTDGYIARAVGDRTATSINNALVKIQPKAIVFLGLSEIESGYLRAHLPEEKIIDVASADQLSEILQIRPNFRGEVICKPNEVIRGLVKAFFERKRLVFSDLAESLPLRYQNGGSGLVALEEENEMSDIAGVNLAFSCGSDIVLLPIVENAQLWSLPRELHNWSENPSHHAYQAWKRHVRTALRKIDLMSYEFVTFFTTGLPYGLFVGNSIRCCHVQKYRDTTVAIVDAITHEHMPTIFASALLFSPELFESEETKQIGKNLGVNGYSPLGKVATVRNLANFGAYYPYDVLHICSHGGETDGYFTIRTFRDREWATHTIKYYEVVGFAPTGGEKVLVQQKLIFHKFDGHTWMSQPLASFPKFVFEDMLKSIKSDENVIRVPYRSPIALSCHIQCYSSIHQGHFDQLSGFGHPIVFNNTCASSHELAVSFLHAGARCYIGTLWSVGNETARRAAIAFYQSLADQPNLLTAFHEMLGEITGGKYRNIYIFWGFHFSTLAVSKDIAVDSVLPALMFAWHLWLRKISTTEDQEVKRNALPVIRFLADQIIIEMDHQQLGTLEDFDAGAIDEIERGLTSRQERSPFVEISEFDQEI